jgi:hypothetical protein
MPTTLPRRIKPKTVSTLKRIVFAVAAVLLILLAHAIASPAHADKHDNDDKFIEQYLEYMLKHERHERSGPPEKRIGYYGFMHGVFHQPFYEMLRKWNVKSLSFSDSCCSGSECRVTEPLQYPPPEFKALGFTHMVLVDGDWYPIKLVDKQTGFTPEQVKAVHAHPLFEQFVHLTHVCASKTIAPSDYTRNDPEKYRVYRATTQNSIYCVLDGGDKM